VTSRKHGGIKAREIFHLLGFLFIPSGMEKTMSWIYLFIAGLFEIVWAIGLKYTQEFARPLPFVVTIAGMIVSSYFLSLATRVLPIETAYASRRYDRP
jgi:hypothetical protein